MKTKEDAAIILLNAGWTMEEVNSVLFPQYSYPEPDVKPSVDWRDVKFKVPYEQLPEIITSVIKTEQRYSGFIQ